LNCPAQNLPSDKHFHHNLLTIDSHPDTPLMLLRPGTDFMQDNSANPYSRVDYPRMQKGGLDAVFFAVFIPQGALESASFDKAYSMARKMIFHIDSLVSHNSEKLGLAVSAEIS